MVKHTQTIRWLLPRNCLSVSDRFVGLALKRLNMGYKTYLKWSLHELTDEVKTLYLRRNQG